MTIIYAMVYSSSFPSYEARELFGGWDFIFENCFETTAVTNLS